MPSAEITAARRPAKRPANATAPLREACAGLAINPVELARAIDPDERREARDGETPASVLLAFGVALLERRALKRGQRPDGYNVRGECKQCGPVWLPTERARPVSSGTAIRAGADGGSCAVLDPA